METSNKNIRFDLFENALDFILSSVLLSAKARSIADFKYCILHLSAGVELLLKERLRKEGWQLLFEKIEKASELSLESGDFMSVRLETAIERLENSGVSITGADKALIHNLKKRRNKIEHFEFQETELSVKSAVAQTLNFTYKFINGELSDHINKKSVEDQYRQIQEKIVQFDEFVNVRKSEITDALQSLGSDTMLIDCPHCYQKYLALNPDHCNELACLFCLKKDAPESMAFFYVENIQKFSHFFHVKDGDFFPLYECPECDMETLVQAQGNYVCFNCCDAISTSSVETCCECNKLFFAEADDGMICSKCWEYKISRD